MSMLVHTKWIECLAWSIIFVWNKNWELMWDNKKYWIKNVYLCPVDIKMIILRIKSFSGDLDNHTVDCVDYTYL